MSLQRADRSLEQVGLEPIECVGQTYDPEKMEALAVVTETNRSAAEVVEEIRRGYSWRGKIFRVAQVSVSKT
jgi:molecular chaperone GrpE